MECSINTVANILNVTMSGKCTFSDYAYFQQVLDAASSSELQEVKIFLSDLDFIDSSGLGMLLMLRERSISDVSLISPKGQVERMLHVAKLTDVFNVVASN